jgi:hypothetical protein
MRKTFLIFPLFLSLCAGIPLVRSDSNSHVQYGVYYYVWNIPDYGNGHWGGNATEANPVLPSTWWRVKDIPVLWWYNSSDPMLIRSHFAMMHGADIDFALVSWWGNGSAEDSALKVVFDTLASVLPSYGMKLAVSVEPFREAQDDYNFSFISDYVYDTFVSPYRSIYLTIDSKPVLTWMQGGNMTDADNRESIYSDGLFANRIIGDNPYVNWSWWFPNNGHPEITSPQLSGLDGFTSIIPRYDDSGLGYDPYGKRERDTKYDENLTEGKYQEQWDVVNGWISEDKVGMVMVGTWNDFNERTFIEPAYPLSDYDAYPFSLLDICRANIAGVAVPCAEWYENPVTVLAFGLTLLIAGVLVVGFMRRRARAF